MAVTAAANPAFLGKNEQVVRAIGQMGRGVWSQDGSMAFWGDWRECPEWVEIMSGAKAIEDVQSPEQAFTPAEMAALKKKHGTAEVNWDRALAVKRLISKGTDTVDTVAAALSTYFGRTQLSKDLAALKAANNQ